MPDQFEELLDRLVGVKMHGADQADARCPCHDDRKASLSVGRGQGGRILLQCHAGCGWSDVLKSVGLSASAAFGEPVLTAEYVYTDATGKPLYMVERWDPKDFRQRLADGARRTPPARDRVLYNLPAVLALQEQEVRSLFYVEGEKDVHSLADRGYCATTTMGGANKPWQPAYSEALAGLHVVIVADNDVPGKRWARKVAENLDRTSTSTIVVPPQGIKDVTELLEAGFAVTDLIAMPDTLGETLSAAEYPVRQVEWLWPGRMPLHMLTLLEGDPGTGKSTLVVELMACLTTGRPLPGVERAGSALRVGVLSDEDNWSMVVVPRLKAAGADLHKVIHFRGIRGADGFLSLYSLADLSTLRHDIGKVGIDVLIVDPIMAYFGNGDTDTYKDSSVRSILGPMVQMAEEDQVSILAVRHFTKGSAGGKAIYRGGGSIGFTGQARAILQTAEHPEPDHEGQFILAVAKCNLAPLAPSLGYGINTDSRLEVSRIAWQALPVPYTAQQLQRVAEPTDDFGRRTAVTEAVEWLEAWVAKHWVGVPFKWSDVLTAAREDGIGKNTLQDKARPQVLLSRIDGPGGNRAARWIPISQPDGPTSQDFSPSGNGGSGGSAGEVGAWSPTAVLERLGVPMDESTAEGGSEGDARPSNLTPTIKTENGSPLEPSDTPTDNVVRLAEAGQGAHFPCTSPNTPNSLRTGILGSGVEAPGSGPPVCTICGATDGLVRYSGGVGWRCLLHNPLTYTAGT